MVLLTLTEVARHLNVSVKTVRRRIALKQLRAIQPAKFASWRVDPKDLDRYKRENSR